MKISMDKFKKDRWNHPDNLKRKSFVWVRKNVDFCEVVSWCENNIKNDYFYIIPYFNKGRVWFIDNNDAFLFKFIWG